MTEHAAKTDPKVKDSHGNIVGGTASAPEMTLTELKAFAATFEPLAKNKGAVVELAITTKNAHPHDKDLVALCNSFESCPDADAVMALIAKTKKIVVG
jgi:hypothetical protein